MTANPLSRGTRDACHDLLARYGHALDWLDEAALAAVFWPDAAIDYGFFRGSGADFVPAVMAIERGVRRRFHLTTGTVLRPRGAGSVVGDSLAITQGVRDAPGGGTASTVYYGRYADRFDRRDGIWRIAARTYLFHGANQATSDTALPLGALMLADRLDTGHRLSLNSRTATG